MQVGRLADLAESQARVSRPLEAFAPSLASFFVFVPRALELRLSALHLSTGFPLRVVVHFSGA
jgi:hypothetical protein